jgi:hypothetical protein
MRLDDIESADSLRVELYLVKIKVLSAHQGIAESGLVSKGQKGDSQRQRGIVALRDD